MAHTNVHVSIISKSSGLTAAAALAYRHAQKLTNENGEVWNYENRAHVVAHTEILVAGDAPAWAQELASLSRRDAREAAQILAAEVELAEGRNGNARLFREFLVTILRDHSPEEVVQVAKAFAERELLSRGMIADVSVHLYGSARPAEEPLPAGVRVIRVGQEVPAGDHVLLMETGRWYRYQPHAHILTALRPMTENGFGAKRVKAVVDGEAVLGKDGKPLWVKSTDWDAVGTLEQIRTGAEQVFKEYAEAIGYDYLTRAERELITLDRLDPEPRLGAAKHMAARGEEADAHAVHRAWRASQVAVIEADPTVVLGTLAHSRATFTKQEIASELFRYIDDSRFGPLFERIMGSPELVMLGNPQGEERYTVRDLLQVERILVQSLVRTGDRETFAIAPDAVEQGVRRYEQRAGVRLTEDQRATLANITGGRDLAPVEGLAGTGKTKMLEAANEIWQEAGYRVQGAALSRVASDGLESAAHIPSRSVAGLLLDLDYLDDIAVARRTGELSQPLKDYLVRQARSNGAQGLKDLWDVIERDIVQGTYTIETKQFVGAALQDLERSALRRLPDDKTVLVIDESGMVGTRAFSRISSFVDRVGAKLVPLGDREQGQAIEAGAPFRLMVELFGASELNEIWRQRTPWMRDATRSFGTRRGDLGFKAYIDHGAVRTGIESTRRGLVDRILVHDPKLGSDDIDRLAVVARYLEARNATGVLFRLPNGIQRNDFQSWKALRDDLTAEIVRDIRGYAPWLGRVGIDLEELAADYLVGRGSSRREANAAAEAEVGGWGIKAYPERDRDLVKALDFRSDAKLALFEQWKAWRSERPDAGIFMLAYSRADVADLNRQARSAMAELGLLGPEIMIKGQDGEMAIAVGDRVMFLANDAEVGVRNGTLGTVLAVSARAIEVQTDARGTVTFDPASFSDIQHGYASTIHKAQGATVDLALVLNDARLDRHLLYVAMSRHRDDVRFFSAAADAASDDLLLSIARVSNAQENVSDYGVVREHRLVTASPAEQAYYDALEAASEALYEARHFMPGGGSLPKIVRDKIEHTRSRLHEAVRGLERPQPIDRSAAAAVRSKLDLSKSAGERAADWAALLADPGAWVAAQTRYRATVNEAALRDYVGSLTADASAFAAVKDRLARDPGVVELRARDGSVTFGRSDLVDLEQSMWAAANALNQRSAHAAAAGDITHVIDAHELATGRRMPIDQRQGVAWVLAAGDLKIIEGAGAIDIVAAARPVWEQAGYRLMGATVAQHQAAVFERATGVDTRSVNSLLRDVGLLEAIADVRAGKDIPAQLRDHARAAYDQLAAENPAIASENRDRLHEVIAGQVSAAHRDWFNGYLGYVEDRARAALPDARTILVIADGHWLDSQNLEPIMRYTAEAGAKVVIHHNRDTLQAVGAGAAVRAIADRVAAQPAPVEARQQAAWQRAASEAFVKDPSSAVGAYAHHGRVHAGIDADFAGIVASAEKQFGPLTAADRLRVELVAGYMEARAETAALYRTVGPEHEAYRMALDARTVAAEMIIDGFEGYRPWLARAGVHDADGIARHSLAGTRMGPAQRDTVIEMIMDRLQARGLDGDPGAGSWQVDLRAGAKAALVSDWLATVQQSPSSTVIIQAASQADVADLNGRAREALKGAGLLGPDAKLDVAGEAFAVAVGDRLLLGQTISDLDVRRGALATVLAIDGPMLDLQLGDGRVVQLDSARYHDFDYGYALTVRRASSEAPDIVLTLFSSGMDRQTTHSALTIHTTDARIYASRADAPTVDALSAAVARNGERDSTLDYVVQHRVGSGAAPRLQAMDAGQVDAAVAEARKPIYRLDRSMSAEEREATLAAIEANPFGWLRARTERRATVSEGDLEALVFRLTDSRARYEAVKAAVTSDPSIAVLRDRSGELRFAMAELAATERQMLRNAWVLDARRRHALPEDIARAAVAHTAEALANQSPVGGAHQSPGRGATASTAAGHGAGLPVDQRALVERLVSGPDLVVVDGTALNGADHALRSAKNAWEDHGYRVMAASVSHHQAQKVADAFGMTPRSVTAILQDAQLIADARTALAGGGVPQSIRDVAQRFHDDLQSGVPSVAKIPASERQQLQDRLGALSAGRLESVDRDWLERYLTSVIRHARERLPDARTVLVVDGAGQLDSRSLDPLLAQIREAGAKIVLLTDQEHLQPYGPGAGVRAIADRVGSVDLSPIANQAVEWQRLASAQFATGHADEAVRAYALHNRVSSGISASRSAVYDSAERTFGPTSPADSRRLDVLVDYFEARRAASAAYRAGAPDGVREAAVARRDQAAHAIGEDFDGYRIWLARVGETDMRDLARHYLSGSGIFGAKAEMVRDRLLERWDAASLRDHPEAGSWRVDLDVGAKQKLVDDWVEAMKVDPGGARAIIANRVADVEDLNRMARDAARGAGLVSDQAVISMRDAPMALGAGDRVRFGSADRQLGVTRGELGTVRSINGAIAAVELDSGRLTLVDTARYQDLAYGYAVGVDRSTSLNVKESFVLFTPEMDRHRLYAAMINHSDDARLYASAASAPTDEILAALALKGGDTDSTLDYEAQGLGQAERRPTASEAWREAIEAALDQYEAAARTAAGHEAKGEAVPPEAAERLASARATLTEALAEAEDDGYTHSVAKGLAKNASLAGEATYWLGLAANTGGGVTMALASGNPAGLAQVAIHASFSLAQRAARRADPVKDAEGAYKAAMEGFMEASERFRGTAEGTVERAIASQELKVAREGVEKAITGMARSVDFGTPIERVQGMLDVMQHVDPELARVEKWMARSLQFAKAGADIVSAIATGVETLGIGTILSIGDLLATSVAGAASDIVEAGATVSSLTQPLARGL